MIRTSQAVLLLVLASLGFYVTRLANAFRDRVLFTALAVIGMLLILAPNMTNRMAALLGIGRGADLVIYLFILFALFAFARLVIEVRTLQRSIRLLTQELALRHPVTPTDGRTSLGQPLPPPTTATHPTPPVPSHD